MSKDFRSYTDDQELDRPDLNKCPDCGCYFASDTCPLCKKICPEEMRAGNRKPVKAPKKRRTSSNGRVSFIAWYHQWWFIVILFLIVPLAGLVVLFTSPHKFWKKILFVSLYILLPTLLSLSFVLGGWAYGEIFAEDPVNESLSKEEYIQACQLVTPEKFYRSPDEYDDAYLCLTLEVEEKRVEHYATYYICHAKDDQDIVIVVYDYLLEGRQNYMTGDVLTIYGESAESSVIVTVNDTTYDAPCINAAYVITD